MRSSSLHRLIIHVSQTAAYSRSSEQFSIPASEKWGFVPFSPNLGSVSACVLWGIHHLLTYNISIQYVLVIHVHVTYRVCTSEVKTDEETKIIRCPYCGGTAILRDASFVYGTHSHGGQVYVCSHYPSCNSYVGVHPGTKIPKRNARQPGASSKADSGTSNFRSDLATGHPFQTGSISLGGR